MSFSCDYDIGNYDILIQPISTDVNPIVQSYFFTQVSTLFFVLWAHPPITNTTSPHPLFSPKGVCLFLPPGHRTKPQTRRQRTFWKRRLKDTENNWGSNSAAPAICASHAQDYHIQKTTRYSIEDHIFLLIVHWMMEEEGERTKEREWRWKGSVGESERKKWTRKESQTWGKDK